MELLEKLSEQAVFINGEVIPWVLRAVMVGLGLSLTLADFKRVVVFPKGVGVGLTAQLVGLPLAAFAFATLFMRRRPLRSGSSSLQPVRAG